jgi:hypothetical protein
MRKEFDFGKAFDQSFGMIAFALNRHLIDHMLRATKELGVDMESLVIWGIVAHLNVIHLIPPGSRPESLLDESGQLPEDSSGLKPVRLRDLECITGIPRETIRRKLLKLEKIGHLARLDAGWVYSRQHFEPKLRDFTREAVKRFLATSDEIESYLSAKKPSE